MIKTFVFSLKYSEGLTKFKIESFLNKKNISVVKWAVVGVNDDCAKILVSFLENF